jgi:hypothetical protein
MIYCVTFRFVIPPLNPELDALNCNLASALYLLSQDEHPAAEPNLATGFRDDGDGKLTTREAHAWLIDKKDQIIDPTPTESLKPLPSFAPDKETNQTPEKQSIDMNKLVEEAVLTAGLALVAYRRRKQVAAKATRFQAEHALTMQKAPEALGTILTALYGAPGSKIIKMDPNMTPGQVKQKLRSIPTEGVSLREVKDLLADKGIDKPSKRTELAIMALSQYERAARNMPKAAKP